MITFPFNSTDYAFTLEDSTITFSSNVNSFFSVEIILKYYDFYSDVEHEKTLNYKIPIFSGKAKFDVGKIIHRNLANYQGDFSEGFQYKTPIVTFKVSEHYNNVQTIPEILDVKYIAGYQPKMFENNIGLLDPNPHYCRVTPNGNINVSFLLSEGSHVLKILKNTREITSSTIVATGLNAIYTKNLIVSDYDASPGDIFKIILEGTSIFKEVGVYPETILSHQLLYVNSFKLLGSLELLGDFYFPDEYDQIKHLYKRGLIEVLEIIETTSVNTIKINTGSILKSQVVLIDEILNSKKAFIFNIEGEFLELVPISKKRTGLDSSKEIYSYDLDFRINKKRDA